MHNPQGNKAVVNFVYRKPVVILLIGILVSLIVHLPFVNEPPYSQHVWRQALTLGVADNFYNEDMNILYPRVDNRMERDGVTGMHFPLYEWLCAALYQVFGPVFPVHRLLSFFFGILGAVGMYLLTDNLFRNKLVAAFASWFYIWSPELFYDHFIALPDVIALPAVIWGLYLFLRAWERRNTPVFYFLLMFSALALLLGGLVKLQYLGVGFFIAGLLWNDRKNIKVKELFSLAVFGAVAVLPALAWYRRSGKMIEESGLADVGLELKPAESLEKAFSTLGRNLWADIPETILGWLAFACLFFTLFLVVRNRKWRSPSSLPWILAGIGYFIYHIMELRVLDHHQYYMLPYLVFLLPLAGYGAHRLTAQRAWLLLTVILLIHPALTLARMLPSRFANGNKMIPAEFYNSEQRNALRNALPDTVPVFAGPDESLCIYFYFLGKHGWVFRNGQELSKKFGGVPYLDKGRSNGCLYLYTSDEKVLTDSFVRSRIDTTVLITGRFHLVKLVEPDSTSD